MVDRNCILQVLGCLMQRPQYLSEIDKYNLSLSDFPTRFEKYIFSAIYGLYNRGATKITPIDIENYLNSDKVAKSVFNKQNGFDYTHDMEELVDSSNFDYYYDKMKKINLLNDLKRQGFDTDSFYIEDLLDSRADEVNARFEQLTIADIIDGLKKKIVKLETNYKSSEEVQVFNFADEVDEFLQTLKEEQNLGLPIQGTIYTQVINGAEAGALTIRSGGSGTGKTRSAVGDACYLAYPLRYDKLKKQWIQTGSCNKVLFIITEQTKEQINKMILAYLTEINESRFKYADFSEEESDRLSKAAQIVKKYRDNFIILKMPNPNIELIKAQIRELVTIYDIRHVFYDYIFIGPSLLNEFKGFALRNDEVLLMFATALKDLAVELQVSMMTSTQVNSKADATDQIRNEASLAGGRATINKADNGAVMARPSKEELEILEPLTQTYGVPNMVTDVYKVRSGQWTNVRIWSIVDLGTLRKRDLFITDANLDPVSGFFSQTQINVTNWEGDEEQQVLELMEELNE